MLRPGHRRGERQTDRSSNALMRAAGWSSGEFAFTRANGKGVIDRDIRKKYWKAAQFIPHVIFRDLGL